MTQISYQLYSSRNFAPLEATFAMLAKAGFREVEGYGDLLDDPQALKASLDGHGLRMTSCHIGLEEIEQAPGKVLETARLLGMEKVFAPYLAADDRHIDTAGWRDFGTRLAAAGAPLREAGLIFGWHNHDFELTPTPQGDVPLDAMIAGGPELMLELDLGWVRVAGYDPAEAVARYAAHIATVHVKDIAPDGQNVDEDGWADVGTGIMDWPAIHAALQKAGVTHYVAEHDNPSDHARFAQRSIAAIMTF